MIELDKSIYGVLHADVASGALGALGVTGVYVNGDVPENAVVPYIRFGQMAAPATHTMGGGPIEYECVYMVLVVDDRDANGADGKLRASAIANRVKALLHKQPLTLDDPMRHLRSLLDARLDLPDPLEGRKYEQIGANYRIWVEEQ
jgi:hypothetical protein